MAHQLIVAIVGALCAAQPLPAIPSTGQGRWTINTSDVKEGRLAQARRYFEAGWLPARREALKRGYIKSFRIVAADQESATAAEFVLITEYADDATYAAREKNFDEVFASLKSPRPVTIDGLGRDALFASVVGLEDYREVAAGKGD